MGLLDRWVKKTEKEQLEKVSATGDPKDSASKKVAKVATGKSSAKKAVSESKVKVDEVKPAKASFIANKVLLRPLVTEKSAVAQASRKYSFIVSKSSTKSQVKRAILEVYGVAPTRVNMINVQGRWVQFGRLPGRRSDYKKAVVTLPEGKSITVHEGV